MRKLLIFLVFLFFLIPCIGNAAIAIDTTGNAQNGSLTTQSYSQTIAANATLIVVEVLSGAVVTATTVGGLNPTGSITNTSNGGYVYYLNWWFNPPTGAQTVSATVSFNSGV